MSLSNWWKEYLKTRSKTARNMIVKENIHFVSYLVGRVIHQLPPGLTKDDLIQYGVCGLIEAVERYDPNQGAKFETYAAQRIKGAILDEIRKYGRSNGGLSRNSMKKLKSVEEATKKLEILYKRHPEPIEIANEMNISLEAYYKILSDLSVMLQISLDDIVGSENNMTKGEVIKDEKTEIPEEEVLNSESNERLGKAIDELPEKEKMIILLYYYEEMKLREIGKMLNLSEARISQLHTKAMIWLRNKLDGGD